VQAAWTRLPLPRISERLSGLIKDMQLIAVGGAPLTMTGMHAGRGEGSAPGRPAQGRTKWLRRNPRLSTPRSTEAPKPR